MNTQPSRTNSSFSSFRPGLKLESTNPIDPPLDPIDPPDNQGGGTGAPALPSDDAEEPPSK